jgi:hypothetical protein
LEAAEEICAELNNTIYRSIAQKYGMPYDIDGVEWPTRFEIEIENYCKTFFMSGAKKFYSMNVTWKEGMDYDEVIVT